MAVDTQIVPDLVAPKVNLRDYDQLLLASVGEILAAGGGLRA